MNRAFLYFIVFTGIMNMIRMAVYLISSDAYNLKSIKNKQKFNPRYLPKVSVIVPAYNEQLTISRTVESLLLSNYPKNKLEIIVVNDGSTDRTPNIVRKIQRRNKTGFVLRLLNQQNSGKAAALNLGIKRYATGQIIMCLDADSAVDAYAIRRGVQRFRDKNVVSVASNVNIIEDGTLFSLIQRIEYLVCYQMKKAQTILQVEYIIGGIGSMFRRSVIESVGYYDSNTMTEDIDLTIKVIANGKKGQKLMFADDCITYTEPVHSFKALLRQRFRWKYGRTQTFFKHPQIFFSKTGNQRKRLSWFMLPFAIFQDLLFFFEPFAIIFIIYISIYFQDPRALIGALFVITLYLSFNVWNTQQLKISEKLRLTYYLPPSYVLMYVLSLAEYLALILAVVKLPKLRNSISGEHTKWQSPERAASTN